MNELIQDENELIHDLPIESVQKDMSMKKAFSIFGIFIVAGIITGFVVSTVSSGLSNTPKNADSQPIGGGDVVQSEGIADKKTFKDSAEGILREGGSESGEGSFHLERQGGEDQVAYLTSSTVDLSKFIGKKVRVHGETFNSKQVAWLMDVGYIEVIK